MAQFLEIKAANPDCLLFYRMGDFYELFFEDAVAAAQALGIVLTKRGKHLGDDIPMCGVPIHRADEYLQRLIKQGFRVAVCEQLEDPAEARKRGSKAVVRRDVVRLVTPGTLTEDSLLDAKARNYLTAVFDGPKGGRGQADMIALASLDISTGEFEVGEVPAADFPGEIVRLSPSEVIAADRLFADEQVRQWIGIAGAAATPVPGASFDSLAGERLLKAQLGVADLAGLRRLLAGRARRRRRAPQVCRADADRPAPVPAAAAQDRARQSPRHRCAEPGEPRAAALAQRARGRAACSAAIDRTVTGPGARELAARLSGPLRDPQAIARAARCGRVPARERDPARGCAPPAAHRARHCPRHLPAGPAARRAARPCRRARRAGGRRRLCAACCARGPAASACRMRCRHRAAPDGVLAASCSPCSYARSSMRRRTCAAMAASCAPATAPTSMRRAALRDDSRKVMAALEAKYLDETGIKSLKVRHNNILGYYIEVPAGASKPLMSEPLSATFRHRQTMAGAVRFTTPELVETESRIVAAAERALSIEQEVFAELAAAIAAEEQALGQLAAALAELDCEAGLAELAAEQGYARPVLDDSTTFEIRGGRHPVVEQALQAAKAGAFIGNDCVLAAARPDTTAGFDEVTEARIWLVTGPNMAGKSTFLRQNALIAVLAQMGSFVPAALRPHRHRRPAVLARRRRRRSRPRPLDLHGRDGGDRRDPEPGDASARSSSSTRSAAARPPSTASPSPGRWWNTCTRSAKCRALFATHYHELTALAGRLAQVANVTMDVREWREDIVFLHKVKPGAADRSYGIQVAKLAGLPKSVTARAAEVLALLEKSEGKAPDGEALLGDLPLFAARPKSHVPAAAGPSPVEEALAAINPDELTPKAALEALYRLKDLAAKDRG